MQGMDFNKRMTASFVAMLALVMAISFASWRTVTKLEDVLNDTVHTTGRKMASISKLATALADMRAEEQALILYFSINDTGQVDQYKQRFQAAAAVARTQIDEIRPLMTTDEARAATVSLDTGLNSWNNYYRDMIRLCGEQKCADGLSIAASKIAPLAAQMSRTAAEVYELGSRIQRQEEDDAGRQIASSRWITILLVLVSLGICGIILFAVRKVGVTLRTVAHEVGDGSDQVASAATEVASASQSLAQGASEQAASLEETSASAQEIGSMTQKNAENARAAADLMGQATQIVATVDQSIAEMAKSMAEINGSSAKISKIIKVIDEIAFQTNILALNAAVEAARAGEAGMGFAVVADEVRNLAQRSAQAAKDTATLIDESIRNSNEGKTKLEQVTRAMSANTDISGKVKTLVDEVNVGSHEQARAIEQIAGAITQMEQVTQKTAAHAEQSASASEQMTAQAHAMKASVEHLRDLSGGSGSGSGRAESGRFQPGTRIARSSASPGALKTAVSRHAQNRQRPESKSDGPVFTAATAKDAFPMDDDFKEF